MANAERIKTAKLQSKSSGDCDLSIHAKMVGRYPMRPTISASMIQPAMADLIFVIASAMGTRPEERNEPIKTGVGSSRIEFFRR